MSGMNAVQLKCNIDSFVLIHAKSRSNNRTFKSDDKSVLNKWMKIIAKILRDNEVIKQTKKDGILDKEGQYQHKITKQDINCPNMVKINANEPLHCNIYYNMKEKYQYNQQRICSNPLFR